MFEDRKEAAQELAGALQEYDGSDAIVLAIPKGGIELGYYVAQAINAADLDVIVSRKLPSPGNPELGFGAVAEDGSIYLHPNVSCNYKQDMIDRIVSEQEEEIRLRIKKLRPDRALPELQGKTVIIVDDGIAMGVTMRASIEYCRHQKAGRIVVAVPVASPATAMEIATLVDDIVALEQPPFFMAVGQVYNDFHDVPYDEAIDFLNKWHKHQGL